MKFDVVDGATSINVEGVPQLVVDNGKGDSGKGREGEGKEETVYNRCGTWFNSVRSSESPSTS